MIGTEWLIDATGCRAEDLKSLDVLRALFAAIIRDLSLKTVHEPAWHVFPEPGGITGFVMLTESHLACHTYPELGLITINLYCCRPRPEWPWRERLTTLLGASDVRIATVERGVVQQVTA